MENRYEVRASRLGRNALVIYNRLADQNVNTYWPGNFTSEEVQAKCDGMNKAYKEAVVRKAEILAKHS